jgi:hypothetical protein
MQLAQFMALKWEIIELYNGLNKAHDELSY